MNKNKNKINNRLIILSLVLVLSGTTTAFAQWGRYEKMPEETGLLFEDYMKDYKEPVKVMPESERREIEEFLSKTDSMKRTGQWSLDEEEYTFSNIGADRSIDGERIGLSDYKVNPGSLKDPNQWTGTLDPSYIVVGKGMQKFLTQPMSDRQRILLMTASKMIGWSYSQSSDHRLVKHSGKTDCSGFIVQAYESAGIKMPYNSSRDYVGGGGGTEVSWDDRQPGDVIWMPGHVEMYLGKDLDGQEYRLGAHGYGNPLDYRKFNPKTRDGFKKIFRFGGRDNPLTQKELNKIRSK